MLLKNIHKLKFLERLNRFVGLGEDLETGKRGLFHIWDTGRLKELLFNWNEILVQFLPKNENRKYNARLIWAKSLLWDFILTNSLLHSELVEEYLKQKNINYKKEVKLLNSRIDFLLENEIYVEIKWCTLVKKINNEYIASFPDAPTTRWQKHLEELIKYLQTWKKAELWFLLTNNVDKFTPNYEIDKNFSEKFYKFLENNWKVKFLYVILEFEENIVKLSLEERNVEILKSN